jgi:hypothetical protein
MARRQCHTHTHTHTPCYLEIRLINRIQVGFDLLLGQGVSAVDNLFSCPKIHDKRHKTFFRSSASNEICRFANCVIITECMYRLHKPYSGIFFWLHQAWKHHLRRSSTERFAITWLALITQFAHNLHGGVDCGQTCVSHSHTEYFCAVAWCRILLYDSHEEINIIQYVCMNPPAKFDSISVIIYIYIYMSQINSLLGTVSIETKHENLSTITKKVSLHIKWFHWILSEFIGLGYKN